MGGQLGTFVLLLEWITFLFVKFVLLISTLVNIYKRCKLRSFHCVNDFVCVSYINNVNKP